MDNQINNIIHKELATGRWQQLSFVEQMANVGSEINRALNWQNKKQLEFARKAVIRALELLDFTISFNRVASRFKELTRLREFIVDYFFYDNQFAFSEEWFRKYFYDFNYVSRKNS